MRPGRGANAARGRAIAQLLCGAWRAEPQPPDIDEPALADALTPLLRSGSAPLAWWVVARSPLRDSAPARQLHGVYAVAAVQSALREEGLLAVLRVLEASGREALLGKGWAAARLYPEPGLRPSGDFDLYPRREDGVRVRDALAAATDVDVHPGLAQLDDRDEEAVFARAETAEVRGVAVRVFAPEDHLRLLALHFLGHGAWRPAWLCDVAAALESRPAGFDWDDLGRGNARRTEWTRAAIALAHELLGASLDGVPDSWRMDRLPRWLPETVLAQWGDPAFEAHGRRTPLRRDLRRPLAFLRGLRRRWPNAVEASVAMGAAPDDAPRLPLRLAESVRRTILFASRLRKPN